MCMLEEEVGIVAAFLQRGAQHLPQVFLAHLEVVQGEGDSGGIGCCGAPFHAAAQERGGSQ